MNNLEEKTPSDLENGVKCNSNSDQDIDPDTICCFCIGCTGRSKKLMVFQNINFLKNWPITAKFLDTILWVLIMIIASILGLILFFGVIIIVIILAILVIVIIVIILALIIIILLTSPVWILPVFIIVFIVLFIVILLYIIGVILYGAFKT